ncbi:MAG: isoprenylcysteine carboxylmethyltransferase family protein [Planctomycetota bacterium]
MSQIATPPAPPPSARATRTGRLFTAPLYLVVAFATIHLLDKHFPAAIWFAMPGKMIGWGPVLLGCGFCAAGATHFARHRTTLMPRRDSRALVTAGVFALTRNPMYLGMTLILLGLCVIAGSATVWVVPPLFVVAIDRGLIRIEERMLAQRFGDEYADYRTRVRRWL